MRLDNVLVKLGKAVAVFGVEFIEIDLRLRMIVRRIAAPLARVADNLSDDEV